MYTVNTDTDDASRFVIPVNGSLVSQLSETQNFTQNAARYRQVEFLSGKVSFYIINEALYRGGSNQIPVPGYLMIGMYTRRRWYDQQLEEQVEAEITKPETSEDMWKESAETPGYSVRLCNYITSGKGIQKLSFRASKSSFDVLKANPTGFQVNLPLDPSIPNNTVLPGNVMDATVDITDLRVNGDDARISQVQVLVSRTLLVRFKGAITY